MKACSMLKVGILSTLTSVFLLAQGGIQPAHAFPWDYLARTWWTSDTEDDQIEFAISFEYGRVITYRPEYRIETVYRVLQETDDKALIITRNDDAIAVKSGLPGPSSIYFTVEFLCFYRGTEDLQQNNLIRIVSPSIDFPHIIETEEAFFSLTEAELLGRVKSRLDAFYYFPIERPETCEEIVDNWQPPENRPLGYPTYPFWQDYWHNSAGKRTVYPRSGF